MARNIADEIFVLPEEQIADGSIESVVRVTVLSGLHSGASFSFIHREHITVGSQESADIQLSDKNIAPQHLSIHRKDRAYVWGRPDGANVCINAQTKAVIELGALLPNSIQVLLHSQGPLIRVEFGLMIPFGNYQFIGRLGGGGMAEVFLARQKGIGGFTKNVAIKLIHPDISDVANADEMFMDEARIAAELNHNNLVRTHEVGKRGENLFISMEYLRGISIYDINFYFKSHNLRIPPELAAALMGQACAGLHALHELRDPEGRPMNVVHRDISHSNVMCTPDGIVKVIDFGLAKDRNRSKLTDPKILKGKPAYMSPEQVQSRPVDKRTDVWAIGVMLYELCTGEDLFSRADIVATLYAVISDTIPLLSQVCPGVSPLLDSVINKALARKTDDRFATAQDFSAELRKVCLEYGGQFLNHESIAQYFTKVGIDLTVKKPAMLRQVPESLRSAKQKPSTPRNGQNTFVENPSQLCDRIAFNGVYKLSKHIGEVESLNDSVYHIKFIAQVASQPSIAPPIDITRPALNKPLFVSLIGRTKEFSNLSADENQKLADFVNSRQKILERRGDVAAPFTMFHESGPAWPNGPTLIAYPFPAATLELKEFGKLALVDKLQIMAELGRTLQRAIRLDPTFVHGMIRPENIGVTTDAKRLYFAFLGFSASAVLQLTTQPQAADPFLAPECRQGALPSSSSDVYSLGVVLFALLDGDLSKLSESFLHGKELPRLPPNRERPAYIEPAVLLALDRNPAARPAIAELMNRLLPPPATPPIPAQGELVIYPPPSGAVVAYRTPGQQDVKVSSIEIVLSQSRRPIPLSIANNEMMMPAPLVLVIKGAAIEMELAAPPSGADAPQLYRNAHEPTTKLRSYPIAFSAKDASVEVGHRRTWVQRLFYSCVTAETEETNLSIALPDYHLRIESRSPALRLVVMRTTDNKTGCTYLVCILVRM